MQLSQAEISRQETPGQDHATSSERYTVSGRLDFSTVPQLAKQASALIKSEQPAAGSPVVVDMSQVSDCNSAGLALLVEMTKQAAVHHIALRFEHLPDSLLSIAKAYGIENEIREFCE